MKNIYIFCHSFQKVKSIYYIDSLHSGIFQAFISSHFDDYGLQIMKTPNSVSQKIQILGWASFCMNYCINVAWHGGNQPVALIRCNGSPGCFDSGLQVICIVGSGVSLFFLLTRYSMGFRSAEFAGQSSTVTPWSLNQLLVPLAVWAGAKSCWKMKSASP